MIIEKLRAEKYSVRRYLIATLLMTSLIMFSVPVSALAFIDLIWPIREQAAFFMTLGIMALSMVFIAIRIRRTLPMFPSERKIALLIEKCYPELMDSLICSVELLESDRSTANPLSRTLIDAVENDLATKRIHEVIRKETRNWYKMAGLIVLAVVAVASASFAPVTGKAVAYSQTIFTDDSDGLKVRPGDVEIAQDDDLTIVTEIIRGPVESKITLTNAAGEFTYNMYRKASGHSSFDIFGVDRNFAYYITTSRLKSKTYRVTVYEKPAIVATSIKIQPPAYTRLPTTELSELKDFSVPSGSKVRMRFQTNTPVIATIQTNIDRSFAFQELDRQEYETEITVTEGFNFTIILRDQDEHVAETDRYYHLECVRDFAPLIQKIAPENDEVKRINSEVSYSYKVSDDYGIAWIKLYYAINGDRWDTVSLFSADTELNATEKVVAHRLSLTGLVVDGDVISYYCTAGDNAYPKSNVSVTDFGFIEIRPEKPDPEDQQDGHGGEMKTLKVSDLIVEQKHLIRSSWNYLNRDDQSRRDEEGIQELTRSAADLHHAAKTRLANLTGAPIEDEIESIKPKENPTVLDDIVGKLFREAIANAGPAGLGIGSLGKVGELFENAIANMGRTVEFLRKSLPEESFTYQHSALSDLVSLEIELEKNSPPPSGKGGEGESGEAQKVEEENQQRKEQEKLSLLEKLLVEIKRLIHGQSGVNDTISRESENMDKATAEYIEDRQKEILKKTSEVRRELSALPEAYAGVRELDDALREMRSVTRTLAGGAPGNSQKHGQLASQFLQRSRELIESLQQNLAGGQIARLSKALEDVINAEASLTQETRKKRDGASDSMDAADLTKTQKKIRDKFDELLKNMGSAARDLEESNPGASRELNNALDAAGKAKISGKMKRAENASRYDRFDRAVDYQEEVTEALAGLSQGVSRAMQHRASLSSEELGRMLQRVAQHASELEEARSKGASDNDKASLYQSIDESLKDITKRLNSGKMDQISNSATGLMMGVSETAGGVDADIMALLHQTAGVLESRLMLNTLDQKVNLSRVTGQQPPDEFKKLVNAYFKRLSRSY